MAALSVPQAWQACPGRVLHAPVFPGEASCRTPAECRVLVAAKQGAYPAKLA